MDILEFIVSIIDSIIRPLVVAFLVLKFREPISKVILRLATFKYKDLELSFDKELAKIRGVAEEAQLEILPIEAEQATAKETTERRIFKNLEEEIASLAEVAPLSAIITAWSEVEIALMKTVHRFSEKIHKAPSRSSLQNMLYLQKAGILGDQTFNIIEKMGNLNRNVIHHRMPMSVITPRNALEYGQWAQTVINKLEKLTL